MTHGGNRKNGKREVDKYRRIDSKIAVKMSETVIRKHAIGCLPKILRIRTILCINIHRQFK